MLWISRGIQQGNDAAYLVWDFRRRKMLARLGCQFDPEELTDFEVEAFLLIESEFAAQEAAKLRGK